MVEMLKVPARSPPVPHVSITGSGARTGKAKESIVRANPSISSTVSPLVRSARRNAPICDGVDSPDITADIAADAWSFSRDSRCESVLRMVGQRFGSVIAGQASSGLDARRPEGGSLD